MSGPDARMRVLAELFPRTKFVPPATDARVVPRADLHQRLTDAVGNHALSVLSAPAGAGKTTATVQWVDAPGRWRPAWLRLDAADDTLQVLAWALLGALRSLGPEAGRRLGEALHQSGAQPPRLAAAVVNDLADPARHRPGPG